MESLPVTFPFKVLIMDKHKSTDNKILEYKIKAQGSNRCSIRLILDRPMCMDNKLDKDNLMDNNKLDKNNLMDSNKLNSLIVNNKQDKLNHMDNFQMDRANLMAKAIHWQGNNRVMDKLHNNMAMDKIVPTLDIKAMDKIVMLNNKAMDKVPQANRLMVHPIVDNRAIGKIIQISKVMDNNIMAKVKWLTTNRAMDNNSRLSSPPINSSIRVMPCPKIIQAPINLALLYRATVNKNSGNGTIAVVTT